MFVNSIVTDNSRIGIRKLILIQARIVLISLPLLWLLISAVSCSCGTRNNAVLATAAQTDWTLGEESLQTLRSYEEIRRFCASPSNLNDILDLLNSDDHTTRINIANLLTRLRRDHVINADVLSTVVPALLEVIKYGDNSASEKAIISLINATTGVLIENEQGEFSSSLNDNIKDSLSTTIIYSLTEALADERGNIPQYAAHALAPYRTQARIALPELRRLLIRQDEMTRLEAAIAIGNINPDDAENIISILMGGLKLVSGISVRKRAIRTLGYIGDDAIEALPLLREFAEDDAGPFQVDAQIAIESILQSAHSQE
jgi:HEAT repeat protein